MRYIANAFSMGMLECLSEQDLIIHASQLTIDEARAWVARERPNSCVGHADTARLVSAMLETPVEVRRVSMLLNPGDHMLVAQYSGPRLPEGATSLPEGARIRWILAEVHEV